MADYIVLKHENSDVGDQALWSPVGGSVEADNAQQAIRRITDGKTAEERSGTFVAVPARSWQPLTRKVETVEKDAWS